MYIYVLDIQGKPLMPTQRAGKVRRMLRDGRAVIAGHTPFTIRPTYETTHYTQPVSFGVDAGSKHVGLSATSGEKELLANAVTGYVHGRRTSGYFVVKDMDGNTVSDSISYKKLRLIRHNNRYMFNKVKRNGPNPPTAEAAGFLGHLS